MLIVRHHVIADHYPIGSTNIDPGQVVALNSSGNAVPVDSSDNGSTTLSAAVGVCGDTKGTASANTFYNKAWEMNDETAGSGRLTVYNGGGIFYVDYGTNADVDATDTTLAVGNILRTDSGAPDGEVLKTSGGTNIESIYKVVSTLPNTNYGTAGYADSGIPGVNLPVGDIDTARKFVLVRLILS